MIARGRDISVRELLDRGVADLRGARIDDPLVRAELLETLADIQLALNNFDPAYEMAKEAFALRAEDSEAQARSREQLARMEAARGDYIGAIEQFQIVLGERAAVPLVQLDDRGLALRAALAASRLGQGLPPDESIALFSELADEHRRRYGEDDKRTRAVISRLAMSLGSAGRTTEERVLLRQLDFGETTSSDPLDPLQAQLMLRRARLLRDDGDYAQARDLALRALAINREIFGENDEQVVVSLATLASVAGRAGNLVEARAHHEEAARIAATLPPLAPVRLLVHHNFGTFLAERMGEPAAAIEQFEIGVGILEQSGKLKTTNLMISYTALAHALTDAGRTADALRRFKQAMEIAQALGDNTIRTRALLRAQIDCLLPAGERTAGAPEHLEEVIAEMQEGDPDDYTMRRLITCRQAG